MGLSAWAAGWFLVAALPIGLFVAFSDMARMKIPNLAVYALVASYAVLGLVALPLPQYLWHWTHLAVMLPLGIALNAAGAMGAGDAKFIAAASPMVALADLSLVVLVLAASLLGGVAAHRLVKHSALHRLVPHWESWRTGNRFPMGFPLAMALVLYLLWVLVTR